MEHYVNDAKSGVRIQAPLCDRQIITELSSDFSLPDYQPQIKRLLQVRAIVLPADKYVGAGSTELSGTVEYHILYCGEDGELYCATQAEEYRFTCPLETPADFELSDGVVCDVESVPDMVVSRVAAPRRLSVKCRLRSRVRLYGTRLLETQIRRSENAAEEEPALERLCQTAECARLFVGVGEPLRLGDEILCDSNQGDLRVISAEGQVFVTEATAGSDAVNCRGELCLKLLCAQGGEQNTAILLRRIPFSQAVSIDGVAVNCDCCADGVCTEVRVTVEENRILCEAAIRLRARAQCNQSLTLVRDLYATSAECRTETRTLELPVAWRCFNGNFSLNTTLPWEEVGIKQGTAVVDLYGTPTVNPPEEDRGKCCLTGKCRFRALLSGDGDWSAQEFEVPFRYEADGMSAIPGDYDVTVDLISCRARMDGERIGVDAELSVSAAMRGVNSVTVLSEARLGEPVRKCGSVLRICYPSREDTLWSVAKRYHRPVEQLAETNGLSGAASADSRESLAGVSYLLV